MLHAIKNAPRDLVLWMSHPVSSARKTNRLVLFFAGQNQVFVKERGESVRYISYTEKTGGGEGAITRYQCVEYCFFFFALLLCDSAMRRLAAESNLISVTGESARLLCHGQEFCHKREVEKKTFQEIKQAGMRRRG